MKEILVTKNEGGQRFDKYLLKYFNTAPKSFIYKMLRKKRIKLNGKKAEGNEILTEGDCLGFYLSPETMDGFMAERSVPLLAKAIDVVYEDNNILIINKPAGLLSHSESKEDEDTLIGRVLYYLSQKGEYHTGKESTFAPALCNRLDRNTSGLVLCGKNLPALQELNRHLAQRQIDKYYVTMVKGRVERPGVLTGWQKKDRKTNRAVVLESGGKEAVTEYSPIISKNEVTLLKIKLVTGKTHQIRAHLAHAGYPVLGDPKYGDREWNTRLKQEVGVDRQLLHSLSVTLHMEAGVLHYLNGKTFRGLPDGLWKKTMEHLFGRNVLKWEDV